MTDQPHNTARQSTPDSVLLSQLMDSNLAKHEREWFAAAKIERLTVENERFQLALLMVRTALGLHRDSHDDLVVVAQKLRAENEAMKLEVAALQAENASLWALAKFGREMLSARNLSPIPLSGEQMDGLRAVVNDLAELCDLLRIDPNSETLVETTLAKLPEAK